MQLMHVFVNNSLTIKNSLPFFLQAINALAGCQYVYKYGS